jgi:hypothetical protein
VYIVPNEPPVQEVAPVLQVVGGENLPEPSTDYHGK